MDDSVDNVGQILYLPEPEEKGLPMAASTIGYVSKYVHERRQIGAVGDRAGQQQRRILRRFAVVVGDNPARITARKVRRWLEKQEYLAPGTRRLRFSIVRGFCRWLVRRGVLAKDPTVEIPPPKVPRSVHRSLFADQTKALMSVCDNPKDRLLVLLGLQLGLRAAEVAGLQLGDMNLAAGVITVTGKGGHKRNLPLEGEVKYALRVYLQVYKVTAGPLIRLDRFPTRGVQPGWISERGTKLCRDAGIKQRPFDGVSFHAFRHTAASDMHDACGDVVAVRDALGHVSLGTTQIYVRSMSVERLRKAMAGRTYSDSSEAS